MLIISFLVIVLLIRVGSLSALMVSFISINLNFCAVVVIIYLIID